MKYSEKTKRVLKALRLEEKAALLGGKGEWESHSIGRLGVPAVTFSDGPSGVRRQLGEGDHLGLNASEPATCFPSAATVANSWDVELAEQVGEALGEEARALGVDVLLGPGLNIKRSPLCGRNFEYFSEDPYLAGKMAAGYVRGIQSQGISACPKHFAVNSQEERRMAMNAVVDERTLREIYLTGFEIAVKEGKARTIMTSYNQVNGTYANENSHLLRDILRKEWGFNGIVVTDWGGSNDHTAGVKAGSNVEMPCPGYDSARGLIRDYEAGKISMDEIDRCVGDLLENVFALKEGQAGSAQGPKEEDGTVKPGAFDQEAHHQLARRAAGESIVLLKNEEEVLPLNPGRKVAVIGDFAREPRYQGAGSSCVNCTRLEKIQELIGGDSLTVAGQAQGYIRNGKRDPKLEEEALGAAKQADIVLYFFGLDEISESEGLDRTHMRIPENQVELLKALYEQGSTVIGILSGGSAIEMPWEKYCKAILHTYLGGQAGAGAALDVLTGRVNPSGKLNETYPMEYSDTPAYRYFPAQKRNSYYREGLYVGYRYYETAGKEVRYPFGYGLSYTSFAYSDLKAEKDKVTFHLKNTGMRDGAEVAQLYVSLPDAAAFRPALELKGFAKVFLKAGEEKLVTIRLDDKAFRYWDVRTNRWEQETGNYRILVGASCEDIRLEKALYVKGTKEPAAKTSAAGSLSALAPYRTGHIEEVTDEQFEALLGYALPEENWGNTLDVNDAMCRLAEARNPLAKLVGRILKGMKESSEKKGKPDLNILFIYNMPFRALAKMTGGAVSMDMAEGIVFAVNGHFFRGMGRVIRGFFANSSDNKKYAKRLEEFGNGGN